VQGFKWLSICSVAATKLPILFKVAATKTIYSVMTSCIICLTLEPLISFFAQLEYDLMNLLLVDSSPMSEEVKIKLSGDSLLFF
jgi:hypothetical protein